MTYERGVGEGRPDISVLVELTVLSKLWRTKKKNAWQLTRDISGTMTDNCKSTFMLLISF